jgi:hypothetical protein
VKKKTKKEQNLPRGWNEQRLRDVITHYETQTEDEQFAEIEAARHAENLRQNDNSGTRRR